MGLALVQPGDSLEMLFDRLVPGLLQENPLATGPRNQLCHIRLCYADATKDLPLAAPKFVLRPPKTVDAQNVQEFCSVCYT